MFWKSGLTSVALLCLMTAGLAGPATAAKRLAPQQSQQGAVTGTVVDERTRQPLAGVQVHIPGTRYGTLTNQAGRFALQNVPAGQVVVRVELIGYGAGERPVVVQPGQSSTLAFALRSQAVSLNEIVVTGTAGGTQRRAVGNVVDRLDATRVTAAAPAVSVQQVLGQRNAGVTITPPPGMVGAGSRIVIRGASSLSLTNNPIVYVDGTRIDSNPNAGPPIRQGRQGSRLNDINPEDIASIEVIKGPAAATLYGTEASNGVIQIITKRGAQGAPKLELAIKQGGTYMPSPAERHDFNYHYNRATSKLDSLNIFDHYKQTTGKDLFTTGQIQGYAASLKGGTESIRYYLSADWDDQVGIVDYNWHKQLNARMNLNVVPNDKVEVSASLGFVRGRTRFAQAAVGFGIWDLIIWSNPSLVNTPTGGFRYASAEAAASVDSRADNYRFTGNLALQYKPWTFLTQRLSLGIDMGAAENSILFPRVREGEVNFFGARKNGEKYVENVNNEYDTFDYAATATFDLTRQIRSATSFGAQYYRKRIKNASALGRDFPTPDVTTVAAAAVSTGSEDLLENKTLGAYVQQQLEWRNRVFVTAAVRGDDNSAFGAEYQAAYYPKFSATWVASEEEFWAWDFVNTLRLRTAWGQAGRQPDYFDAITLFEPTTGPGNAAVLTPLSLGNPQLKPERGSELEAGLDAGLFDERVALQFTYFDKTTTDAIVGARVRPSVGFPGSRIVNAGRVKNWGIELSVNSQLLRGSRLGWDVGVAYATHKSKVEDLGGLPPILHGTDQEHRIGYPISSIFTHRVLSAEFDARGRVINAMCDGGPENNNQPMPCATAPRVFFGQPDPTYSGNVNTTVTLLQNLRLAAQVEFQGGNTIIAGDINGNATTFEGTRAGNPVTDPIFQAYRTIVSRTPLGSYDASFAKLRELSATYTLPERWVRSFRSSHASLSAGWRNVATVWQAQKEVFGAKLFDPEIRTPSDERGARYQTTMPPTSQFLATLRVTF